MAFDKPEIYHYTTVEGLLGIASSGKLWATYWRDLNDSSEFMRIKDAIFTTFVPDFISAIKKQALTNRKIREEIAKKDKLVQIANHESKNLLNSIHENTFGPDNLIDPFVISFCTHENGSYEEKNGLLSQWRGYGAGGGVAVVFDAEIIKEQMRKESTRFGHTANHIGDVIYERDDFISTLEKDHPNLFLEMRRNIIPKIFSHVGPKFEPIADDFIIAASLLKHQSFYEEREVRIVISPRPKQDNIYYDNSKKNLPSKPILYRSRNSKEIKYIEAFDFDRSFKYPIKRVIIGPSPLQNKTEQQIRWALSNLNIEIVKSTTPYIF